MATIEEAPLDMAKLEAFVFRAVDEVGATLNTALVVMGDRLGLYRALAGAGPLTPAELAERTGTAERYVREWLNAQAAGGYVEYDPESGRYTLPPEQALALTDSESPAYLPGLLPDRARVGARLAPHHGGRPERRGRRLARAQPQRVRRLRALLPPGLQREPDLVVAAGARRRRREARAGRDRRRRRLRARLVDDPDGARRSPSSTFIGSDYHAGSIETARRAGSARPASTTSRFEVAPAAGYGGARYDFVTMFDCLHDMGDPVGAARHVRESLAADGTWMIVEPRAGDRVEENLNPVGRAYYGFSTLLCTPASLSQEVGLALGAQAGEARIRDVVDERRLHALPPRGRDAVQPRLRGAARSARRSTGSGAEQTRARYPTSEGYVERDGVRVHYEVFGSGEPTVLLLPTWSIVHSRAWKMQVPYLARHLPRRHLRRARQRAVRPAGGRRRVRRGGVRGRRARRARRDRDGERVRRRALDGRAARAAARGRPPGARRGRRLHRAGGAARGPDAAGAGGELVRRGARRLRGLGQVQPPPLAAATTPTSSQFFFSQIFSEPHSTKQIEDCVGWAPADDAGDADRDAASRRAGRGGRRGELAARVRCPVLVIHGLEDAIRSPESGAALAELTGGALVSLEGSGHAPHARDPVKVNLLLREFIAPPRAGSAGRAAGHAASARSTSPRRSGSATRGATSRSPTSCASCTPTSRSTGSRSIRSRRVLEARGERIHPASARARERVAATSSRESAEHDLHCFQALRRMDEILLANFMVFHDLVRDEPYDLWIGDEAWELDYYLHENPELKSAAYVWLTDFVGWLPMPDGGEHEAFLTADYNAEMIEHIARYPRLRDRAIFVGDADDVVAGHLRARAAADPRLDRAALRVRRLRDRLRPGRARRPRADPRRARLRARRAGLHRHRRRLGRRRRPPAPRDRRLPRGEAARARTADDRRRGAAHRPRVAAAARRARGASPTSTTSTGMLAACDLAVVQGGLTTTMELTANRAPLPLLPARPPLRAATSTCVTGSSAIGAGRAMDFATDGPEEIAAAIADEIGRDVDYRPVGPDGAARAAAAIAQLL